MVRPKRVGFINIKVTARSSQAGDAIERILKVEPEGEPQYENMAIFVDLRDKTNFDGNFTVDIPKNAILDSTSIKVSAVGVYNNLLEFLLKKKENIETIVFTLQAIFSEVLL